MAVEDVVIDLVNYKDRVGSRVVPGRYNVIVDDVESDTSRAGNPMINLWLVVVDGESEGSTLIDRLTITDKALFRVVGFLQAIGVKTPKKRFKLNPQMFVGRRLTIDVDDGEPYNGRVKSEVRGYMKFEGKSTASTADDLDDLEATTGAADPDASPEAGDNEFTSDTTDTSAQTKKKDTTGDLADVPDDSPAAKAEETSEAITDVSEDDDGIVEIDLDEIDVS